MTEGEEAIKADFAKLNEDMQEGFRKLEEWMLHSENINIFFDCRVPCELILLEYIYNTMTILLY